MNRTRDRLVSGYPLFEVYLYLHRGRKYSTFDWRVEAFLAAGNPTLWHDLAEAVHEMFDLNRARLNRRAELVWSDNGGIGIKWPNDLAEQAVALLRPPLEDMLRTARADGPALRRRYWTGSDEPDHRGDQ
jgi:hypothetical protein